MPKWPEDYLPLLLSLKGRQNEDSLEGEVARAAFDSEWGLHVVAPVLPLDVREATGWLAMPLPKHFRMLETFLPPGGQVWAEGEGTAAFAQAMPDGSLRVLRLDAGENGEAVVDPLAAIRKPSGFRPEPVGVRDQFDGSTYDFDAARERMSRWVEEHVEFAVVRKRMAGQPADDGEARAFRMRDLAVVVLGCMEPRVHAAHL